MTYKILICPVCAEQVDDDPYEGARCYHAEYGNVEPVEVSVAIDAAEFASRRGLALFRLQEDKREIAFREAERRWFASLPKEERARIKAERRAQMSPMGRLLDDMVESMVEDARRMANESFSWDGGVLNGV
jgi:hypothetical protein